MLGAAIRFGESDTRGPSVLHLLASSSLPSLLRAGPAWAWDPSHLQSQNRSRTGLLWVNSLSSQRRIDPTFLI